jgi:hypothetical protein
MEWFRADLHGVSEAEPLSDASGRLRGRLLDASVDASVDASASGMR